MSDLLPDNAADVHALQRCALAAAAERTRRNSGGPLRVVFAVAGAFVLALLSACTAEQMYASGRAWQRNQCNKMPDKPDADRCAAGTDTTYEAYKRDSEPERR